MPSSRHSTLSPSASANWLMKMVQLMLVLLGSLLLGSGYVHASAVTISDAATYSQLPDVAVDTNGVSASVFVQGSQIFANVKSPSGAWLASPVTVSSAGSGLADSNVPKVRALSGGGFAVAWVQKNNVDGEWGVFACKLNAGTAVCSAPVAVFGTPTGGNYYSQNDMALAVDDTSGKVFVVDYKGGTGGWMAMTAATSVDGGATWSAAVTMSDPGSSGSSPRPSGVGGLGAAATSGKLITVGADANNQNGISSWIFDPASVGTEWSNSSLSGTIDTNTSIPMISVSAAGGKALAIWKNNQNNMITYGYSADAGTTWVGANNINAGMDAQVGPVALVTAQGRMLLTWNKVDQTLQSPLDRIIQATFSDNSGTNWSNVEDLLTYPSNSGFLINRGLYAAGNSAGDATVAWAFANPNNKIAARSLPHGLTPVWDAESVLYPSTAIVDYNGGLAGGGSGVFTLIWTEPSSPAGSTSLTKSLGFSYPVIPLVTGVYPNAGAVSGSTSVTILGTGFTGATAVTLGGNACTSVTVVSSTEITCTTPAGSAGPASALVAAPGGTSAANTLFNYLAAPQCIAGPGTFGAITVSTSCTGTTQLNGGAGFGIADWINLGGNPTGDGACTFNFSPAIKGAGLKSQLSFLGGTETISYLINGSSYTLSAADLDNVTQPPNRTSPILFDLALSGNTIVKQGDFASGTVVFNNAPSSVSSIQVALTNNNDGGMGATVCFDATAAISAATTVGSISPTSGSTAGGTSVTISGTNLTGASAVTIGGNACTAVTVVSATSITCTTPAGTAGTASVLVTTPGGTNVANSLFTYTAPVSAPTAGSISPTSGSTAGGTSVTITGTNLTGASAVTIGGNACTAVTVVSATSITCTTPAGTAGTASVLVTTPGGTNVANTLYNYMAVANGVCGGAAGVSASILPSANLCASGSTPSIVSAGGGGYSWSCAGTGGGNPAACTAPGATTPGNGGSATFELVAGNGCSLQSVNLLAPPAGGPGNGVTMPYGVVDFTLVSCVADRATVRMTYSTSIEGMQFWKYINSAWVRVNDVVLVGNTATFTIVDNGPYDADPRVGVIADPGGPGFVSVQAGSAQAIPTLSEWAMILLSGLIAMVGVAYQRRQPTN